MAQNKANVSSSKPYVEGAISIAPLGTEIVYSATTPLPATYKSLGYLSNDGITQNDEVETDDYAAYGGDVVMKDVTKSSKQMSFTCIETKLDTLKFYYGADNVSGTEDNIEILEKVLAETQFVLVRRVLLGNRRLEYSVAPVAQIVELGERTYKDGEPIGYPVTVECFSYTDETEGTFNIFKNIVTLSDEAANLVKNELKSKQKK